MLGERRVSLGLVFSSHFALFIISSLAAISISLFALDLNQSFTLEVVQEGDDTLVDVVAGFGEHSLLRLFLLVSLLCDRRTLGCLLRVGLRRSFALTTFGLGSLFHVFFADPLTLLFKNFLFFLGKLLATGDFLLEKVALSAASCFLGSARIVGLPAGLESLLAVLFVRVLDQSKRL